MGRTVDFAKRRIAGYVVLWAVILILVYLLYSGTQPTQAAWLLILAFAFSVSWAYTRRLRRRQRRRREASGR